MYEALFRAEYLKITGLYEKKKQRAVKNTHQLLGKTSIDSSLIQSPGK